MTPIPSVTMEVSTSLVAINMSSSFRFIVKVSKCWNEDTGLAAKRSGRRREQTFMF
jgi:hypothetical protein